MLAPGRPTLRSGYNPNEPGPLVLIGCVPGPQKEELFSLMGACPFERVGAALPEGAHCPQCVAMMCTEQCRYDETW